MNTTVGIAGGGSAWLDRLPYPEIWLVDFEFCGQPGDRPTPVCMVAKELRSGSTVRLWRDELQILKSPPFDVGPDTLFVAYYASAEIGCFLALGWTVPARILDLFTEFRAETNGLSLLHGNGLIGALAYFGLPAMASEEKGSMRDLVMSGGPWSAEDRRAILNYCERDVDALSILLPKMLERMFQADGGPSLRLGQALLRGRYMAAVARMEHNGVPIDINTLEQFRSQWEPLQLALIKEVDEQYGVYDGTTFKTALFQAWLTAQDLPWPQLPSGALSLDDETFKAMALTNPAVAPLRELRQTLGTLRPNDLHVGSDGRNRCLLSAFRSTTGRNQPSSSKYIFGLPRWMRGLIKPTAGTGLAYLDFGSQEIAIAAALSKDAAMQEAYNSGDPYMAFAKQAGLAPHDATKITHKLIRDRCKAIVLGVGYGMGAEGIALRSGLSVAEARELLRRHRETYRIFWDWAEGNVNTVLAGGTLNTVFGWPIRYGPGSNPNARSLLNFPMQANGAEMMRMAACKATEQGLKICAPVHDAFLLEAPLELLDDHVERLRTIMELESKLVMATISCRVDAEVVRYPNRYCAEGGAEMWNRATKLVGLGGETMVS